MKPCSWGCHVGATGKPGWRHESWGEEETENNTKSLECFSLLTETQARRPAESLALLQLRYKANLTTRKGNLCSYQTLQPLRTNYKFSVKSGG